MYFIFNVTCTLNEWRTTLFVSVHALGLFFLHGGGDLVLPAEALGPRHILGFGSDL